MAENPPVADAAPPRRRWRAALAIASVASLLFALATGSLLLFFVLEPATREYWVLVHWSVASVMLLPYALYQLRHCLRVRVFAR